MTGIDALTWVELLGGGLILASLAIRACRAWWSDYQAADLVDQPDPLDEHARTALALLGADDRRLSSLDLWCDVMADIQALPTYADPPVIPDPRTREE